MKSRNRIGSYIAVGAAAVFLSACGAAGNRYEPQETETGNEETEAFLDTYLADAGMPGEVLAGISERQKKLIYDTTYGDELRYLCCVERKYRLTDDGRWISLSEDGTASSADLTVMLVGLEAAGQAGEGDQKEYKLYPTFIWNRMTKISNDTFAMAMYTGWATIPQLREFRVQILDSCDGTSLSSTQVAQIDASGAGYAYWLPRDVGFMNEWYEGHAYYAVDQTDGEVVPRLSVLYAHDQSELRNRSYLTNTGAGFIDITGDTDSLAVMEDVFTIDGL